MRNNGSSHRVAKEQEKESLNLGKKGDAEKNEVSEGSFSGAPGKG